MLQLQEDLEDMRKVPENLRSQDYLTRIKAIEAEIEFLRVELRRSGEYP